MQTTVGTCGLCGGPVQVPTVWYGVNPPQPTCGQCGAVAAPNHGPVLPMQPAPKTVSSTSIVMGDKALEALQRALSVTVKQVGG